ncbi:MAG: type IV secretion system DNA-binding domain-containing protein [Thermoplasmata archaeon]
MSAPNPSRSQRYKPPVTIEGGWLHSEPKLDPQTQRPLREVIGRAPVEPPWVALDTVPFPVELTDRHLSTHVLFLGGIGTGKTVAISHLVERIRQAEKGRPYSMVIFDTKGDYLEKFGNEDDLVLTNNPRLQGDRYPRWNLFDDIGFGLSDTPSLVADRLLCDTAYEVSQTLFQEQIRRTNQPFFAQAASEIFFSFIALKARWRRWYRDRGGANIGNHEIAALARQDTRAALASVLAAFENSANPDPGGARGYLYGDEKLTHNILTEFRQVVTKTFRGNFQESGSFSIRDYVKSRPGKALFVEYDIQQGYLLRCAYQVLLDLAITQALGREDEGSSQGRRPNAYFVIDEFALLPALQHLDAGINFGRSLGVKFVLGAQNVGQVIENYGEGVGYGILGGIGNVFEFRLYDSVSRDWVKGRYGQSFKARTFRPPSGESDQVELGPGFVIEDWDVSGLRPGYAIAAIGNLDPYVVKFPAPTEHGDPRRSPGSETPVRTPTPNARSMSPQARPAGSSSGPV